MDGVFMVCGDGFVRCKGVSCDGVRDVGIRV